MIINLISGPRNVSTALMYSFAQRPDTKVVDEPLYGWYLDQTDVDHPGKEEVLKAQYRNYQKVLEKVIFADRPTPHLFLKNMAHHHINMSLDYLDEAQNVFLIRDPCEMLTSLANTIPRPKLSDTAYDSLVRLFDYVEEKGEIPIVIDSQELLKNPYYIIKEVCNRLGIPYVNDMLKWEAGPLPEDGVWAKYWYDNVHRSTGFKPYEPKKEPVPKQLKSLLKKCRPYYEKLNRYAIKSR